MELAGNNLKEIAKPWRSLARDPVDTCAGSKKFSFLYYRLV